MIRRSVSAGLVLGGFRLEERVGVGGMGEVWRARNVKSEKFIRAIKVIRPELAADQQFHQRFLREAEYLEVLQHPNILRVENLGEENELLFMVMELLDGCSVDAWLETKKAAQGLPTVGEACGVMSQVLLGVGHAHANGVIHRDLKPPNFFLTKNGTVKVLDFGIARHGDLNTRVTKTSQGVPGSPGYYAPEFSDGKEASPASDIYALAICLFELLAGRWPFLPGGSTQDQATLSLLLQHATKPMPDVRAFRRDVPAELATIIQRAGAKAPESRPSAEELRAVLLPFAAPAASPSGARNSPAPVAATPASAAPLSTSFAIAPMGAAPQATPPPDALSTSFQVRPMPKEVVAQPKPPEPTRPPRNLTKVFLGSGIFAIAVSVGAVGVWSIKEGPVRLPTVDAGSPVSGPIAVPDGMAVMPAAEYAIGADDRSPFEGPFHLAQLKSFVIDKTEVSVGAVRAYVAANPSVKWPLAPPAADRKPVSNVSVEQAQAFCAWRVKGGRLPTEEEWEAAARGLRGRARPWGRQVVDRTALCVHQDQGSEGLSVPVDAFPCGATPNGIRQLLGNVAEWTSSTPRIYPGSGAPVLKVFSEPGRFIVRGGSFDQNSMETTVTARSIRKSGDSDTNFDVGFRCAAAWSPPALAPELAAVERIAETLEEERSQLEVAEMLYVLPAQPPQGRALESMSVRTGYSLVDLIETRLLILDLMLEGTEFGLVKVVMTEQQLLRRDALFVKFNQLATRAPLIDNATVEAFEPPLKTIDQVLDDEDARHKAAFQGILDEARSLYSQDGLPAETTQILLRLNVVRSDLIGVRQRVGRSQGMLMERAGKLARR